MEPLTSKTSTPVLLPTAALGIGSLLFVGKDTWDEEGMKERRFCSCTAAVRCAPEWARSEKWMEAPGSWIIYKVTVGISEKEKGSVLTGPMVPAAWNSARNAVTLALQ